MINFKSSIKQMQADTLTPVGIYMRLRDSFPQSLLLECTDYRSRHDAYSYICINPVAGIEVNSKHIIKYTSSSKEEIINKTTGPKAIEEVGRFKEMISISGDADEKSFPGLFGFTSYEAVNLFDTVNIKQGSEEDRIPLLKYDLYSVVIAINHFNSSMSICELSTNGLQSLTPVIVSLLANKNTTSFPFKISGVEKSNMKDEKFLEMVREAKMHCARGDLFQIVLSRRFERSFEGDEFSVYRALRSVNPSPYLFYFDFLNYKIFGSSPEAQLQIIDNTAVINPIAGTIPKSGNEFTDKSLAKALLADPKENSEHSMLVDLARNDLSRHSANVRVSNYKEVHAYSHLIHLVSTVKGELKPGSESYKVFADTFPAGTLSGAPKHMAVKIINRTEPDARGSYGGAIGILGLKGNLNHAIIIRSFFSRGGKLFYQAGAGIVIDSVPEKELNEVKTKLSALRQAMIMAEKIN